MLSTLHRNRRTRRQSQFQLETLDDRIVLSAAAIGAVAETGARAAAVDHRQEVQEARHEAMLERHEARADAKEARAEANAARQDTKLAFITARSGVSANTASATNIMASPAPATASSTSTGVSASANSTAGTATLTPLTTTSTSTNPANYVPPIVPTTTGSAGTSTSTGASTGTTTSSTGTLPANVAAALQSLYQEYEGAGGGSSFTPSQSSDRQLQISGTSVGVNLQVSSSSNFSTVLSQLQSDGLQVSTSSATYGLIDGMLPIADLPTVATLVSSVTPMSPPLLQ